MFLKKGRGSSNPLILNLLILNLLILNLYSASKYGQKKSRRSGIPGLTCGSYWAWASPWARNQRHHDRALSGFPWLLSLGQVSGSLAISNHLATGSPCIATKLSQYAARMLVSRYVCSGVPVINMVGVSLMTGFLVADDFARFVGFLDVAIFVLQFRL